MRKHENEALRDILNTRGLNTEQVTLESFVNDGKVIISQNHITTIKLNSRQLTVVPAQLSILTELQILNLQGGNVISDISPLTSLTNLQEIYLNGNRVSDASPFFSMNNLQYLDLSNNCLPETERESLIDAFGQEVLPGINNQRAIC